MDLTQGGNDIQLKVFSFMDTVCMLSGAADSDQADAVLEDGTLCLDDFQFYAIYEERGMLSGQDGIVGLAPSQTNANSMEGPLFIEELVNAGLIDSAVFGLFISRFESKPHSIQIGGYDVDKVEGGE